MMIHPTALVEDGARLGAGVEIGPFCHLGPRVALEDGVKLLSHVVVKGVTRLGARTVVHPGAVLGGEAQIRGNDFPEGRLEIGTDCVLRELVTMNCGSAKDKGVTIVGARGYFMAGSHVGHDCVVGDDVTFANSVALGGHVQIGDGVIFGGLSAVQQFCRQHFADDDPALEADPARELAEEFADALGVTLAPEQYRQRPLGALVATRLTPTLSPRAAGMVTARIYRLFEVEILDGALARAMLANSQRHTDDDLAQQALAQARAGGHGRANAVLALPLRALTQAYLALPPEARAAPLMFEQHTLDANVPVVLEGLALPDFRNL